MFTLPLTKIKLLKTGVNINGKEVEMEIDTDRVQDAMEPQE